MSNGFTALERLEAMSRSLNRTQARVREEIERRQPRQTLTSTYMRKLTSLQTKVNDLEDEIESAL